MNNTLLAINNLTVSVKESGQEKPLINAINFSIPENSIVGLVGGSGSGKTTTGLAILRLLPVALKIKGGNIQFLDEDLLQVSENRMRSLRGKAISMVFQEPLDAFNPVFSIGYQIDEVLYYHTDFGSKKRQGRILELLDLAGIKDPQRVAESYPHQLSGGMRQRAMIAQAIAASPQLIIADEPTSNLDVTLQAMIMELFRNLRQQLKLSILLVTHDLGMVEHLCDEVNVMSDGMIVESGHVRDVLQSPQDSYTQKLMEALSI